MTGINLVLLTIVLFVLLSQTSAYGKCQNYSKCQNGGFCEEHIDPYERKLFATCHCLPSFTGPFCESAISNTADASNCGSGLYTVIGGKEKCICRPGEKGPHCFDDSNNLRACLSTAECTMDPVTYQLKCDCGNGKRFSFGQGWTRAYISRPAARPGPFLARQGRADLKPGPARLARGPKKIGPARIGPGCQLVSCF